MTIVGCFGLAVRDLVFTLPIVPSPGAKSFATALSEQSGGPAATAAVAVARFGGNAVFVGRVGDDHGGRAIIADLEAAGVDATRCEKIAGVRTSTSSVLLTAGSDRTIVNYTDARILEEGRPPDFTCDAVLIDNRWKAMHPLVLAWAERRRIPSVVDLDSSPPASEVEAPASYTIASQPAATDLTGCPDPAEATLALQRIRGGTVGVTAGPEGVWWSSGDGIHHVPAVPVDAVETVGAGDVLHGVFAWAIGSGASRAEAFSLAGRAAAVRCTRSGGWSAIPTRAEMAQ
jgi:sulfofructose kinase